MRYKHARNFIVLLPLFFILTLVSNLIHASADTDIDFIVSAKKPPAGVVFEIVAGSESALKPALEKVDMYMARLKKAIPNIKLSVVTHGTEEFALLNQNKKRFNSSHQKVQSLVSNDVPVHVCGTHASWYDFSDKDFPDYVDVVVAGPAKVKEYQREGYALINIEVP